MISTLYMEPKWSHQRRNRESHDSKLMRIVEYGDLTYNYAQDETRRQDGGKRVANITQKY